MNKRWDIFCAVVDNFGDIGVCWRLARRLAHTYQQSVRLWVDDLPRLHLLCPDIDPTKSEQVWQNITVCDWQTPFPRVTPADIVIEGFGCPLPKNYLRAMADSRPIWINLEYLSAESWVEGCHGLASPHPALPLNKYFFFPGFTAQTGGILYEPEAVNTREFFQQRTEQQQAFWASLSLPPPQPHEKRLSLFCYDNPQIPALLQALADASTPYTCLLFAGPAVKYAAAFLQQAALSPMVKYQRGNLQLYLLPFLEQNRYDLLLWACDINFVRGEDSFIRAQLAARPFVWQIYPQAQQAHHQKLDAFLNRYAPDQPTVASLWRAWNGYPIAYRAAWEAFIQDYPAQQVRSQQWAQQLLAQQDLTAKLILFCKNKLE